MPVATVTHVEKHFTAGDTVRDVVIGMADGLTVPFALAAGISGAIAASHIVVTAGIAELAGGGIAMGVGGYLAARTDVEHYRNEHAREERETRELPDVERGEVAEILERYGITGETRDRVVDEVSADTKRWVVRRKAAVVQAVRVGMISLPEACLRYDLSIEEFLSWQRTVEQHGIPGLRATRVGIYL